jgi:hypothetical protein
MGISFKKYVDITSGIGAGANVGTRELIGRLFTTNPLLPTKSFIEFTTLADVGTYFGTTSEEYKRASFYFSFVSKNIITPQKISYARWVDTSTAPRIYGAKLQTTLNALKLITNGAFSMTLGATTNVVSGLDFSGAADLAAVAAIIQTAIRTKTGVQWTAATVTYDAVRAGFNFVGGSAVAAVVSVQAPGTGTDISNIIGWITGAIWSDGALTETITETLTQSVEASNNFGSFLFMPALTLDQITEAAQWNSADDQNVLFQYMVPVSAANANSYYDALKNYAGIAVTLSPLATEYPEQAPMMILAATNYSQRNSTQNYMFQIFALTPSVTTTIDSNTYDAIRINYYGRTQTAGQLLDFYQRGVLMGLPVNPVDMNIYANEQWFKDAAGAALMTLLLALSRVSANSKGRAQILTTLQAVITEALNNGTISVGGILDITQKIYIAEITGDPDAWYQVQNTGYWVDCTMQAVDTDSGTVEYKATYVLVYKKDDVVRKIEGTHVLI